MFIYLIQEKVLKSENNDFPASAALPDSPVIKPLQNGIRASLILGHVK